MDKQHKNVRFSGVKGLVQKLLHGQQHKFATETRENKFTKKFWQETQEGKKIDSLSIDEHHVLIMLPKKKKRRILVHCLHQSRDGE